MLASLTPARRIRAEILDDPAVGPETLTRSMRDVVTSNRFFGGAGAVVAEMRTFLPRLGSTVTLLDVGTGLGDIPQAARGLAEEHGVTLTTFGVDAAEGLARASRSGTGESVCADALSLPFRDDAFDVVTCSQVLHHFAGAAALRLVREMNRVARRRVLISDLRRSWLAAAGLWTASFPLRFHPVSRHDGVLSVLRGFTRPELSDMVQQAVGLRPVVTHRRTFRLTTSWSPT